MDRPRRSIAKRSNTDSIEVSGVVGKRKKKDAEPVKKTIKKAPKKDSSSDSESSSDGFVRVKSEPGPLKCKEEVKGESDFTAIESSIFDGVTRLSDSESDSEFEEVKLSPHILSAVVDKLRAETVEADSVSDINGSSKKKLQLSKLRKAVNGFTPKEEKRENFGGKAIKGEEIKNEDKSRTDYGKTPDKKSEETICEVKRESDSSKNTGVLSTKPSSSGAKGKKTSHVTRTDQCESTSSKSPLAGKISEKNPKSKIDSKNTQKGARGMKNSEADSSGSRKPKAEGKPHRANNKNEVSSTSTRVEPGSPSNEVPVDIDNLDMNQLLALGENLGGNAISRVGLSSDSEGSDEMENDWEEVNTEGGEEKQHVIPKEGVQITLEMPELIRRRHKKKEDMQAILNRQLNRVRREFQVLFHKVSVLGWLAHGFYVNRLLNNEELLAVALSLVPSNHCLPPAKLDLKYVQQITAWFVKLVDHSEGFTHIAEDHTQPVKRETLERQFARRVAKSRRDLAFLFIAMLRSIDVDARLVISLQPMPLKPQSSELFSIKPSKRRSSSSSEKKEEVSKSTKGTVEKSKSKRPVKTASPPKTVSKRKSEGPPVGAPSPRKTRSGAIRKSYKEDSPNSDSEDNVKLSARKKDSKESKETLLSRKKDSEKDSKKSSEPLLSPKKKSLNEEEKERLKKIAEKRMPIARRRSAASKKMDDEDFEPKDSKSDSEEDGDSDFTPESRQKKPARPSPKEEIKKETKGRKSTASTSAGKPAASSSGKKPVKGLKVLSSSEDEKCTKPKKMGTDYWVEVYIHKEESWVPVDVTRGKVDCAAEIRARATQPITYVIAWNRNDTIKDVTRRYVSQFTQVTSKQRVDEKWWNKTLSPFKPRATAMDKEEEGQLHMAQLNRPMPKSVAECKNHPLYVLKRHLLKFEAIYPEDSPTLGFVKSEPLYARQNVYNLHSREVWIKEAKVVRMGEKPYKIVKARPKYDRLSGNTITDLPLELFGPWQVEDYEPPAAVDGKVPRNAYGNVELFKPSMLPKGCVHLQLPSLNRVARKLQIDCAPAVVGFDYHCGGSHPTYDGFVVCEESVDVLMDAWNKEIEESEKRARERDEKRIYGNWRRIIKGLLIREHLSLRYDFKEDDTDNEPADTRRNEIAAAEARLHQPTAKIQSVFPTLMAKMRSGRGRKSTGPSSSGTRKPSTTSKPKAKGAPGRRRRKQETSSEEEESDFESSSEDEDESEMVLLSDEDSGSEFDQGDDDKEEEDE